MNVQPSVLIWTVICFCLFMLVINKLLFKPVLKLMDERKAKTEAAKLHAAEAEQRRIAAARALETERELAEARMEEERQKLIAEGRAKAEKELASYAARAEAEKQENKQRLIGLTEEAERAIATSMDELTAAYTKRLMRGGQQ